jgi:two-component system chemotaxis response regulator CheB
VILDLPTPEEVGQRLISALASTTPTRMLVLTGRHQSGVGSVADSLLGVMTVSRFPNTPADGKRLIALCEDLCRTATFDLEKSQATIARPTNTLTQPPHETQATEIVAIGASTGGPAAIEKLLRGWPHDFPLPVVVAQHMTAGFGRDMVRWLNTLGTLRVKFATNGEKPIGHTAYFPPDRQHLTIGTDKRLWGRRYWRASYRHGRRWRSGPFHPA